MKKDLFIIITIITLLLSICVIIYGITLFLGGFHNADLVFNTQHLLAQQNESIDDFYDTHNSNGDKIPLTELYIIGNEMMFRALIYVGIGGFCLGLSIMYLWGEN